MSQEILDKSLCLSIHNLYYLYELLCHFKICSIQKEDTLFVTLPRILFCNHSSK